MTWWVTFCAWRWRRSQDITDRWERLYLAARAKLTKKEKLTKREKPSPSGARR